MAFPGQTLAELEAQMVTSATQMRNLYTLRKAMAAEIRARKIAAASQAFLDGLSADQITALRLALEAIPP